MTTKTTKNRKTANVETQKPAETLPGAEWGPSKLPIPFVKAIGSTAETALANWLEDHAPKAAYDLFQSIIALNNHIASIEAGPVLLEVERGVWEDVPQMAADVMALGGVWKSPEGIFADTAWRGDNNESEKA